MLDGGNSGHQAVPSSGPSLCAERDLLRAQWTPGMPVDRYRNEVRRRGREGMQVATHNRVRSCGVGVGRIMDQEQHSRPRLQPVRGGGRGENAARRNSAMALSLLPKTRRFTPSRSASRRRSPASTSPSTLLYSHFRDEEGSPSITAAKHFRWIATQAGLPAEAPFAIGEGAKAGIAQW